MASGLHELIRDVSVVAHSFLYSLCTAPIDSMPMGVFFSTPPCCPPKKAPPISIVANAVGHESCDRFLWCRAHQPQGSPQVGGHKLCSDFSLLCLSGSWLTNISCIFNIYASNIKSQGKSLTEISANYIKWRYETNYDFTKN